MASVNGPCVRDAPAPPAPWKGVAGMTTAHRSSPVEQYTRERSYLLDGNTAGAAGSEQWQERARLVLTPVAAPSILGLFGFFAATLLVGSNMAHWWGTPASALTVFPFAV